MKGIEKLDLKVGDKGKAEVMGVVIPYTRDDTKKEAGDQVLAMAKAKGLTQTPTWDPKTKEWSIATYTPDRKSVV